MKINTDDSVFLTGHNANKKSNIFKYWGGCGVGWGEDFNKTFISSIYFLKLRKTKGFSLYKI